MLLLNTAFFCNITRLICTLHPASCIVDLGGFYTVLARWEMAMVFDSTMSTLLRTGLKVTELEMGTGPELTEGRRTYL